MSPTRQGDGKGPKRPRRQPLEQTRGVFMISVAAELAEMHPQTLRMYEARGLIEPQRSPKNTRLYSQADVERLRRIQEMTTDMGLNLAGVETVLELEERIARMHSKLEKMQQRLQRSFGGEMVPYGAYEPPAVSGPERRTSRRIPISRPKRGHPAED
ncbi:MAG: heat shock protein transcriptional repressor HspR [Solirubrobacterales bacterium]